MKKRVQAFLLTVCILVAMDLPVGFPLLAAETDNMGFKSVNFNLNTASRISNITFGNDMRGNDGYFTTGLNHTNRTAGVVTTTLFDLQTIWEKNSGNGTNNTTGTERLPIPKYNKFVYTSRVWNTTDLYVIHSANREGTNNAPTFPNGAFALVTPINSYRNMPDSASARQAFSFDSTNNRYVGFRFAYMINGGTYVGPSGGSSVDQNAWTAEFEVYYVTPNSVRFNNRKSIYTILTPNERIDMDASVLDIDGDIILDSDFSGLTYTMTGGGANASIDAATGVITVHQPKISMDLTVRATVTENGYSNCYAEKVITITEPNMTIGDIPNTIRAPKNATAVYQLKGYINNVNDYDPNATFSIVGGNATGFSLTPSGLLEITPTLDGTYFTVMCESEEYSVIQNIYIGEKSLIENALCWVGPGWALSSQPAQNALDGNNETYWDVGAHSVGSNARFRVDTGGGMRYNKIKLNYRNLNNSTQTRIIASDVLDAPAPAQSGIMVNPASLAEPMTTLYLSPQPTSEKIRYIDFQETDLRYLMFESTTEHAAGPPNSFALNELSLFYVLPGDFEICGADDGISIPQSGINVYRLDTLFYDTIGALSPSLPDEIIWSATSRSGITLDPENGRLTVSDTAAAGKLTINAVCRIGTVTLRAEKDFIISKSKISVFDAQGREVSHADEPGAYFAVASNANASDMTVMVQHSDDTLVGAAVARGNEKAHLTVVAADNVKTKVYGWDENMSPNAQAWKSGDEPLYSETNRILLEKNFQNGITGSGFSGFYRSSGTVSSEIGNFRADVDKYGVWTHFSQATEESFVIDVSIAASVDAELYVQDTSGVEVSYPFAASENLFDLRMVFNRLSGFCAVEGAGTFDISSLGEVKTVGFRAAENFTLTLGRLYCYMGTRLNSACSNTNDMTYWERTGMDINFLNARAAANNVLLFAVDFSAALLWGERVQLPRKPTASGATAYVPVEVITMLGGSYTISGSNVNASFFGRTRNNNVLVDGGLIRIYDLTELLGITRYFSSGDTLICAANTQPVSYKDDLLQVLYTQRSAGVEILSATINNSARPRVLANQADFDRIAALLASGDPNIAQWYNRLLTQANQHLMTSVSQYQIVDNRLLGVSNTVYDRVSILAFIYRFTSDDRYAERAWRELEAAAAFSDWHPSHFLDVGQMSLAFAVGYDWLYDYLSEPRKRLLVRAFEEKGLAEFNKAIFGGTSWSLASSNWNSWTRGGILSCVLAMAEELNDRGAAAHALEKGLLGLETMLNEFAPQGAWVEGTYYWETAVRYLAFLIDTLENSTARYIGYDNLPGFEETSYFSSMLSGPGGVFNFADTTITRDNPSVEFWLSNRFGDKGLTNLRLQNMAAHNLASDLMDILWYVPTGTAGLPTLENDIFYENLDIAAFHNDWSTTGLFAAVKGADTAASHFHFDGGTFVFDMGGKRFAYELGRDGYAILTNTTKDFLYKCRAEGHNTLVINPDSGPGQKRNVRSKIVKYAENQDERHAVIDLTPLYDRGTDIKRGFKVFRNEDTIVVQDEVKLTQASEMYWFMHIHANTEITLSGDKRMATLVYEGVTISAEILGDANAKFTEPMSATKLTVPLLDGESLNPNFKKLAIHWDSVQETLYAVRFTHGGTQGTVMTPISLW